MNNKIIRIPMPVSFLLVAICTYPCFLGAQENADRQLHQIPKPSKEACIFIIHESGLHELKISKGPPKLFGLKSNDDEVWVLHNMGKPGATIIPDANAISAWKIIETFIKREVDTAADKKITTNKKSVNHAELYLDDNYRKFRICRMHPPSDEELKRLEAVVVEVKEAIELKEKSKILEVLAD